MYSVLKAIFLCYTNSMNHHENVKVIAFVGLTGSGKSAAVDHLSEKGLPKVHFGNIFYDAMREAGIERTQKNENEFRVSIRKKEGDDFIVKRIIKQIHDLINAGQHRVIADGLYSWTEYKAMKHEFPGELTVVAIVAPKRLRHQRLAVRSERPLTSTEATDRDWREIEDIQKGGPIAIADYFVINDGDIDKLTDQVDEVLKEIEF